MNKYLVKLIIFNTIGKIVKLFFRLLVNKNKIFVINYHTTYPEFNNNFLEQIKFFKEYFDIGDLETIKNFKFSKKPKLILTFDDGHVSNFQISKILQKESIPAVFFIPVNFVYRDSEDNLKQEYDLAVNKFSILSDYDLDKKNNYERLSMTHENLLELIDKNFKIGCHSLNHIRLNNNLSTNELHREVVESKIILEQNLKTKIDYFCWVIGDKKSYSSRAYNLIKENYELSFMTLCESFKINSDHHKIHRFNVEANFSLNQVAFILSGIYEFMYKKRRAELDNILSK
jgi:peptidoglycan/xylan/chitin deacetylase (PgdA/CDA1 family)